MVIWHARSLCAVSFMTEISEQKNISFPTDRIKDHWQKLPPVELNVTFLHGTERRQCVNWCLHTTWLWEKHIYCYRFSSQQITHIFNVWVVTHSIIKIPTCLETTVYLKALLMVKRNQAVSHLPYILREAIQTFICLYHYIFLPFFFFNVHYFLFQPMNGKIFWKQWFESLIFHQHWEKGKNS